MTPLGPFFICTTEVLMSRLLATNPVGKYALNLSTATGTPAVVGSWVLLIPALTSSACALEIGNTTGKILKLSTGQPGFENSSELKYFIMPSGSPILLPAELGRGLPISVQAVDSATTDGYLILNLFG